MIDPIANKTMNNRKFIDETESRQAEVGDLGDRGLRGPRDPGVPRLQGGGHAPDAAITLPAVRQPRDAGERGDRGVRGPGEARVPSHRGHAPHADHGDSLPSSEADRGLRGPLEDVDGGEDGGHAPINADISVSDELSKTLVILDNSVNGRSPVKAERQRADDTRMSQYCPSWLQINFRSEYVNTEGRVSDNDEANVVSSFNSYCWQGPGGLKNPPVLPRDLLTDLRDLKCGPKDKWSPPVTDILHDNFCSESQTTLANISRSYR